MPGKPAVSSEPARRLYGPGLFSIDVFMNPSSKSPAERARKAVNLVLHRMQDAGSGSTVATSMGVSESTVSRIKNERLEEMMLFLAQLGLKVVPVEFKCVDPATYEFLTATHQRVLQRAPELVWDVED